MEKTYGTTQDIPCNKIKEIPINPQNAPIKPNIFFHI
tara:strand:+ start:2171 stop:2281 length:111 start_codon:yes stop_codon:yes gene_type:complete